MKISEFFIVMYIQASDFFRFFQILLSAYCVFMCYYIYITFVFTINQRDIFQHVPITSRKPVMPDSKGVPGFFAFWGSSRILMNPGAS